MPSFPSFLSPSLPARPFFKFTMLLVKLMDLQYKNGKYIPPFLPPPLSFPFRYSPIFRSIRPRFLFLYPHLPLTNLPLCSRNCWTSNTKKLKIHPHNTYSGNETGSSCSVTTIYLFTINRLNSYFFLLVSGMLMRSKSSRFSLSICSVFFFLFSRSFFSFSTVLPLGIRLQK
jgi:hypothetical protein